MGCRMRSVSDDENGVVSSNNSFSEVLLFTTMCIIGLPVDVHVKDGSVYSGIFHTACVDNDFGVVLKKAKVTKKGSSDTNVANGALMETLVVLSGDLVQVVAKGVMLPSDGIVENVAGDRAELAVCSVPKTETLAKTTKSNKFGPDRKQYHKTRRSVRTENGFAHGLTRTFPEGNFPAEVDKPLEEEKMSAKSSGRNINIRNRKRDDAQTVKSEEISVFPINGRQGVHDVSKGRQDDHIKKSEHQENDTTREYQGSRSKLDESVVNQIIPPKEVQAKESCKTLADGQDSDHSAAFIAKPVNRCHEVPSSTSASSSDVISSAISTSASSVVSVVPETRHVSLGAPSGVVHTQSLVSNRSTKDSKLNPGAKLFSPALVKPQSPPVPMVSTMNYRPNNTPLVQVVQPEIPGNSFVPHPSLPAKVVPYENLTVGNAGVGSQYSQPIAGHVGGRTQPVRFAGQYHPVQAGPTYAHPNPQVMVGRSGQLFYVHPISHDALHGAAAISPAPTRPFLTPHQIHYPKHQGTQTAQTLQFYVPPHLVAGVQPPIVVPTQIPILQPQFVASRPMQIQLNGGFYSTKFQ